MSTATKAHLVMFKSVPIHVLPTSVWCLFPFSQLLVAYFEIQLCLGTVHFDWKEDANMDDKDHGILNDRRQPWGPVSIMFK